MSIELNTFFVRRLPVEDLEQTKRLVCEISQNLNDGNQALSRLIQRAFDEVMEKPAELRGLIRSNILPFANVEIQNSVRQDGRVLQAIRTERDRVARAAAIKRAKQIRRNRDWSRYGGRVGFHAAAAVSIYRNSRVTNDRP